MINQNGTYYKFTGKINVVDVVDNPDGSAKITFEADKEFKNSFKKYYGLKRWSQKRFDLFLREALENMNQLYKDGLLEETLNKFEDKT